MEQLIFNKDKKQLYVIQQRNKTFQDAVVLGDALVAFEEKAQTSQGLINGGYMVFNKGLLSYLS